MKLKSGCEYLGNLLAATVKEIFKPLYDLTQSPKFLTAKDTASIEKYEKLYHDIISNNSDVSMMGPKLISGYLNMTLQECCAVGEVVIVNDLLNSGYVDPSLQDNTPFIKACGAGHEDIVRVLLTDIRVNPAANNNEALRSACSAGHDKIVEILLKNNRVDPTANNDECICTSAEKGHVEVVKLLMSDERADPEARLGYPKSEADGNGHQEVVNILDIALRNKLHKGIADIMRGNDPWVDYELFSNSSYLGKGACGKVYKVKKRRTERVYAIKEMEIFSNMHTISSTILEARFLTEIEEHPNITKQYDVYSDDTRLWIVYEFMDGGSLTSLFSKWKKETSGMGKFTEATIRDISRQVITGLVHLHANGIVHRDIKADNVLFNNKGQVKIADFGLSTRIAAGGKISADGAEFGDPVSMAPEQLHAGDKAYDEKVDVWEIGLLLGELARCGRAPKRNYQDFETFKMNILSITRSNLEVLNEYSTDMQKFAQACQTPDPGKRPSANDLLKHDFLKVRVGEKPTWYPTLATNPFAQLILTCAIMTCLIIAILALAFWFIKTK